MNNILKTNFKIFFVIIFIYIFKWISPIYNSYDIFLYLVPLFWIILYSYYKIQYPFKNKIKIKKHLDEIKWLSFILFIYFITYLILGKFLGFASNPYSDKKIFKSFWKFFIFIIPQEYIRNLLVSNTFKRKFFSVFVFFLFLLIEIDSSFFIKENINLKSFFNSLLPLIINNIFFIYIIFRSNYINNIIYRFIDCFLTLILPYTPNIPGRFYLLFKILLITLIILRLEILKIESLEDKSKIKLKKSKLKKSIFLFLNLSFMISIIIFFSGTCCFFPIVIVSNSMTPQLKRGDAVIIKKLGPTPEEKNSLKEGDIIAYKLDNAVVVHRIKAIRNNIFNNETYFITKGDSNKSLDSKAVYYDQILGTLQFSISQLGYPSIFFKES